MTISSSGQKSLPAIDTGEALRNKNTSDRYRTLVKIALATGVQKVEAPENMGKGHISIFVPSLLWSKVNLVAEISQVTFQQAWAALCIIGLASINAQHQKITTEIKKHENKTDPVPEFSKEQSKLYNEATVALNRSMIALGEASTGAGKSWVLCTTALMQAAKEKKKPVIIAAPTLNVVSQLFREMDVVKEKMLNAGTLKKIPSIAFFPGATEYVDDAKLRAHIESLGPENEEQNKEVIEWLKNNGAPINTTKKSRSVLFSSMRSMGIEPQWLMEDLREIAVDLNPEDFSLRSKEGSESLITLTDVRERARDTSIIFCTHAMLAYSLRSKWSLLPEPKVLLIDEAHLLEESFANVFSNAVSMRMLRHRLKRFASTASAGKTTAKKASKAIGAAIDLVSNIDDTGVDAPTIAIDSITQEKQSQIAALLKAASSSIKSKLLDEVPKVRDDREAIHNAINIITGESRDRAYINFSPDRRFPSLVVGKSDLRSILGSLWKTATGGSLLVSATIYLTDKFGNYESEYFCSNLAIPSSRIHAISPIVAPWVTSKPTLHVPAKINRPGLCRPSSKRPNGSTRPEQKKANEQQQKAIELAWLNNLGKNIAAVCHEAIGGTLVLCTSYPQVEALADNVTASGIDQSRIVQQVRNEKFALAEKKFRALHRDNKRPVLIALGSAWTGLNLRDHEVKPQNDTLLTDLILACLPIGLNRTTTMLTKIKRKGMHPIEKEALMYAKQGLGRLQRHEHQVGRHLWIMDARIWEPWKSMGNFQLSMQRMLMPYGTPQEF